MADNDFDIDGLAKYLHLSRQQVEKLVSRGDLPGRRVGGQWRFNGADIHHWMENRMGLLEEQELAHVENALAKSDAQPVDEKLLRDSLTVDTIAVPLVARTKNAVIEAMCQLAANTGMLWDPEKMADAVRAREQLQSTAMDNGVALMHSRRPMASILGEPVLAIGVTSTGIPFGGSRSLTDIFFLICSVDDRGHLRTLARLSRILSAETVVDALRDAEDAAAVFEVISTAESVLF
ncbi:MAG: PTS sugar transporter subunit IIA [Planctomycetales bacterium]|nr:PTS sugar transporter subunit IIA [Planctomycetales bacterium]